MKVNYLLILLLLAFIYLISPFFSAIFSGFLLSYMIMPIFKKINALLKNKTLSGILVTIFSLIILTFLFYLLIKMVIFIVDELNLFFINIPANYFSDFSGEINFEEIDYTSLLFSNPSKQVLDTILMAFIIFYTLTNYDELSKSIISKLNKKEAKNIEIFESKAKKIINSIIIIFAKSIILGIILYLSLYFLGVGSSLEIAVISAFVSLIPSINMGYIFLAVSIYNLTVGNSIVFIVLLVESLFFIIMGRNFNSLFNIKEGINPLMFIAGIITGTVSLGIFGFIAGPVLAGLIEAFYETISQQ